MNDQTEQTLLEFPCSFPIKVMGKNHEAFEQAVLAIIQKHVEEFSPHNIRSRPSKNGNYLSITITIEAQSKSQLDAIYEELSAHELVLMAL